MPYTITVSDDKKYIISKSTGGFTNEMARQQNVDGYALGLKLGINRFLIDVVDSTYEGTPIDHYEFANTRTESQKQYSHYSRIAILVHPLDHSHDFFETVSRNAGFDVTIFRDREEAIQHLIHDL